MLQRTIFKTLKFNLSSQKYLSDGLWFKGDSLVTLHFFKDIQEVVNSAALHLSWPTSDGKTVDEMIFGMLEIIGWLDVSMNSSCRYYVCYQQNIPITDEDVEYIHEHIVELINPLLENLKYLAIVKQIN